MASSVKSEIGRTIGNIKEHKRLLSDLLGRFQIETNIRKKASLNLEIIKVERVIQELNFKIERLKEHLEKRSPSKSSSKSKSRSKSGSKSKLKSRSKSGRVSSYKKEIWMGSRMLPVIKPNGKVIEPDPTDWPSYVLVPSIFDGGKRRKKQL
jgi:hypothetical protein